MKNNPLIASKTKPGQKQSAAVFLVLLQLGHTYLRQNTLVSNYAAATAHDLPQFPEKGLTCVNKSTLTKAAV